MVCNNSIGSFHNKPYWPTDNFNYQPTAAFSSFHLVIIINKVTSIAPNPWKPSSEVHQDPRLVNLEINKLRYSSCLQMYEYGGGYGGYACKGVK